MHRCTICLGASGELMQRGCCCRADNGTVHLSCIVEAAAYSPLTNSWWQCSTCKSDYTGRIQHGLATAMVERADTDASRIDATVHLARAEAGLGNYAAAARLESAVYNAKRDELGDSHPATITAAANFTASLADSGELELAAAMQEHILINSIAVNGHRDPATLASASNLAMSWSACHNPAAPILMSSVASIAATVHGEDHPATLTAASNLAAVCSEIGDHHRALSINSGVLAVARRVFGTEHPQTTAIANNLAQTHIALGNAEVAARLLVDILDIERRVLGSDHPGVIVTTANLATAYSKAGQTALAHTIGAANLATATRVLGENHPHTASKTPPYNENVIHVKMQCTCSRIVFCVGASGPGRFEPRSHTRRAMTIKNRRGNSRHAKECYVIQDVLVHLEFGRHVYICKRETCCVFIYQKHRNKGVPSSCLTTRLLGLPTRSL